MAVSLPVLVVAGAALRVWAWHSDWSSLADERVEIVTPVTSYATLVEGTYLRDNGLSAYAGDTVHQSPLLLATFSALYCVMSSHTELLREEDRHITKRKELLAVIGIEKDTDRLSLLTTALYLFQPYTLATFAARSSAIWNNLAIVAALWAALCGNVALSTFSLAVGTCLSLYPVLLLVPIVLLHARSWTQGAGVILAYSLWMSALLWLSFLYERNTTWLTAVYGFILTVPDLTPNVGLYWYFFLEMFDHFRSFFLCVFHLHIVAYVPPLAIKLRHSPTLLFTLLLFLIAAFKTYPSVADAVVPVSLLPLWGSLLSYARSPFVVVVAYAVCTLLLPIMWHLWIYAGSGNANFFYALTIVYTFAHVVMCVDLLQAHGRRLHDLMSGILVKERTADVMMR